MKFLICLILVLCSSFSQAETAAQFLKRKGVESKKEYTFNEYEDIISGSIAFTIGNIGYFTTKSSTLQIAYSGVQTVGILAIGQGIYDYYYPHFETRLLSLLNQKKLTREKMADGYVSLLGEIERAKRLSLLWSSSLLMVQYALNAFVSTDVPRDLKDIYLFLGGVNAIVSAYSFLNVSDYEAYYLKKRSRTTFGVIAIPEGRQAYRVGLGVGWSF